MAARDPVSPRKIMRSISDGLAYDDVLLIPGASHITPNEALLGTRLSRNLLLNIPLVSAAEVTGAGLAVALAHLGGIGIIPRHLAIDTQAAEVRRVKRHEAAIVRDPATVEPETTLGKLRDIMRTLGISGFPVVDAGGLLLGVVTARDVRFADKAYKIVSDVMTPLERLVTIREGESWARACCAMHSHRLERVLVVDEHFALTGIVTAKDMANSAAFPHACKDASGRLRVGAAVGAAPEERLRFEALLEAGADVMVIETPHGHGWAALEQLDWAKRRHPEVDVIVGNVLTGEAALALADAGADAVKVGMGVASIEAHQRSTGMGVPQLSALLDVADALVRTDVPIIADGEIRCAGDISKALAAGASSVMIGRLFAATSEAPGEAVPCRSTLESQVGPLLTGLRSSMGYCGTRTIGDLQLEANFVRRFHTTMG
jgi:IMP dehydrogenase